MRYRTPEELEDIFSHTYCDKYFAIDENNKIFEIYGDYYSYDQLINYEYAKEFGDFNTKKIGAAAAGAAIAGPLGAIAGGILAPKIKKCKDMKIRVKIDDIETIERVIDYIDSPISPNDEAYKEKEKMYNSARWYLNKIREENRKESIDHANTKVNHTKNNSSDNVKIVSGICDNCNGKLKYDSTQDSIVCPYCGAKKIIVRNNDVEIERIKAQKEIEILKLRRQYKEEDERKEKENNRKTIKYLIIFLIIGLIVSGIANLFE